MEIVILALEVLERHDSGVSIIALNVAVVLVGILHTKTTFLLSQEFA